MQIYELIGYAGTVIVLGAYLPQTYHLIKERCSAGISKKAYILWFIAALFLLTHSIMISDKVFIFTQIVQLIFTGLVLFFAEKYQYGVCAYHRKEK